MKLFQYISGFIDGLIVEVVSTWFLLGIVLVFLGLIFLFLSVFIRFKGVRRQGKVIGAINEIHFKEKQNDGKTVKEKIETLYPIYEYLDKNGQIRQEKGSEGGNVTLKYITGQNVNLIVISSPEYDDVYDADEYGAVYLGLSLIVFGVLVSALTAGVYNALGITLLTVSLFLFSVFFILGVKCLIKKKQELPNGPYVKRFNIDEMTSIEDFKNQKN